MRVSDAIRKRRTIRKYKIASLNKEDVLHIIDSARLAPSSANLQSLKYLVVEDREERLKMYPYIKYAAYLQNWNPGFYETPVTFIVVLNDTNIKASKLSEADCGAAITNMCISATELSIDSCWLGAINRDELKKILNIPKQFDIMYILGLGYGVQKSMVVDMKNNDHKYYINSDEMMIVPKRTLDDIIIGFE